MLRAPDRRQLFFLLHRQGGPKLTLIKRLRIRHIHRQLHVRPPRKPRAGDQTRRNGNHNALSLQLAPPPVRPKQLHKFGLAIRHLDVDARAGFEVFVQALCHHRQHASPHERPSQG